MTERWDPASLEVIGVIEAARRCVESDFSSSSCALLKVAVESLDQSEEGMEDD